MDSKLFYRKKELFPIFVLILIFTGMIMGIEFFGHDPLHKAKQNYYFGHSRIRTEFPGNWNPGLNSGISQFDLVFWDKYPFFYELFSQRIFFLVLIIISAWGIYKLFCIADFNMIESCTAAFCYGTGIRFLNYLPVWHYGWQVVLLFIPWLAYLLRRLKDGAGLKTSIFFAFLLLLFFLTFEIEVIIYLLLTILVYLLYSFVDMLDYHRGFLHFLKFSRYVFLSLILAMMGAAYPYIPLLKSTGLDLFSYGSTISPWHLTLVIFLSAGSFLLLRLEKKKLMLYLCCILLLSTCMYVLITILPWIDHRSAQETDYKLDSETAAFIAKDKDNFRIYPIGTEFKNNRWSVFSNSIGGNSIFYNKRYLETVKLCLTAETDKNLHINWNLLKLLNVKYLLSKVKIPSFRVNYRHYCPDEQLIIYECIEPPQYAWFAHNYRILNRNEIIDKLNSPEFQPYKTAYLEKNIPILKDSGLLPEPAGNKIGSCAVDDRKITINVTCEQDGLLIISEIFEENDYWKAFIDQKETGIFAADILLKALYVPSGIHTIELIYDNSSNEIYKKISYWARLLLLLLFIEEMLYLIWRKTFSTS